MGRLCCEANPHDTRLANQRWGDDIITTTMLHTLTIVKDQVEVLVDALVAAGFVFVTAEEGTVHFCVTLANTSSYPAPCLFQFCG